MDRRALALALRALPPGSLVALPLEALLEALGAGAGEVPSAAEPLVDLTVPQVAKLFGRAPSTVRQWLESGQLEGYKLWGREWRVSGAALTAFQEQSRMRRPNVNPDAPRAQGSLSDWRSLSVHKSPD